MSESENLGGSVVKKLEVQPIEGTFYYAKLAKAQQRVIRAAKRWSRLYMHSKPCQCSECLLARAVDALLKLEKESK